MTINEQKRAKIPSCSENDAISNRKRKENDRKSGGKKEDGEENGKEGVNMSGMD